MTKEELMAMGLSDENSKKVLDWIGNSFVPKNRYDDLNKELQDSKTVITERDKQIEALGKSAKGNEELTKQIEDLKAHNKKAKEEYDAAILARDKEAALSNILNASGARNTNALKGMLDMSKAEFKDGKFTGIDEQIAKLKESDKWLFNTNSGSVGGNTIDQGDHTPTIMDLTKL